jgi:predicted HD phosphohydrolase
MLPLRPEFFLKCDGVVKESDVLKLVETQDKMKASFFAHPFRKIEDLVRRLFDFLPIKSDGEVVDGIGAEAEFGLDPLEKALGAFDAFLPFG